jgi:hypothetical protein
MLIKDAILDLTGWHSHWLVQVVVPASLSYRMHQL